jgi:MFS family permease
MLPFFFGLACVAAVSLGTLSWVPAVMMRVYGVTPGIAGLELGIVMLVSIPLGMMSGALLVERLDARGGRASALSVSAVAMLAVVVATATTPLVDARMPYLGAIFCIMSFVSVPFGICAAELQGMVPNEMRGRASALLLLCQNGFGMVLGPLLPGLINDEILGGEPRSIAVALSITLIAFAILAAIFLSLAFRATGRSRSRSSSRGD